MSKWDTGKIEQLPTAGCHWNDGVLRIDGMESRELMRRCMARGLASSGIEMFKRDNRPEIKPRQK